ncbi:uncharacterized protein METZ01_LOCUS234172, partial [marine metagenome]
VLLVSTSDLLLASFQIPLYAPKSVVELTATQRERAEASGENSHRDCSEPPINMLIASRSQLVHLPDS